MTSPLIRKYDVIIVILMSRQLGKVHVQNFFFGGVASRVPWGWRDSYGKTGNFVRVGDKSMLKMYKKAGVGRKGDI